MILAVPAATPVTTPVPLITLAIPALLLLHVPLVVISVRLVVAFTHRLAVPVMGDGVGVKFTVLVFDAAQLALTAVAV